LLRGLTALLNLAASLRAAEHTTKALGGGEEPVFILVIVVHFLGNNLWATRKGQRAFHFRVVVVTLALQPRDLAPKSAAIIRGASTYIEETLCVRGLWGMVVVVVVVKFALDGNGRVRGKCPLLDLDGYVIGLRVCVCE
jgi:hypothetical protein